MWYVVTTWCYSAIEKDENIIYRKMDGTGDHDVK
jgi:hypothetical protein